MHHNSMNTNGETVCADSVCNIHTVYASKLHTPTNCLHSFFDILTTLSELPILTFQKAFKQRQKKYTQLSMKDYL